MDVRLVRPLRDLTDVGRAQGGRARAGVEGGQRARGRVAVDDRGPRPGAERVIGDEPEELLVGEHVVPEVDVPRGCLVVLGIPGVLVPFVGPLEDERARHPEVVNLAQHLRVHLHGL